MLVRADEVACIFVYRADHQPIKVIYRGGHVELFVKPDTRY
jgi:hypothetical protein